MKIAVLSDIHDHIWNLEKAKKIIRKDECEAVIFCGDMSAPFTTEILTQTNLPTYAVWGNVDEDHWAMVQKGGENFFAAPLSQEFNEKELDVKKIAFCHYPMLGKLLAETGYYDAVFHGHTHRQYQKWLGKTLLANPGAVCGIVSGKPGLASFMIYDTTKNSVQLIELK
ncbi:YfcE family phosphodiesterase [Candidatus Woesebacteria bacterium]|nr:YfcE family phosphodiesterase [Candidatus Woesebacteria bacterium]